MMRVERLVNVGRVMSLGCAEKSAECESMVVVVSCGREVRVGE